MILLVLSRPGIGHEITMSTLANLTGTDDALHIGPTFGTMEIGFAGLAIDLPD